MKPIAELSAHEAGAIRFVLFDIDDTITEDGLLLRQSYNALWDLRQAGICAIPVTGRPAGWCDLIARQWPVSGVVGENGAFALYMEEGKLKRLLHPKAPEPSATRTKLTELKRAALEAFPGLRVAKDQDFRLFDLALDFAEEQPDLGLPLAGRVKDFCQANGAVAKVSSIHVNAWYGDYDKLSMSEHFLSSRFGFDPIIDKCSLLYVGDSPNDEPMFKHFPLSCGVSNIARYKEIIQNLPQFVTEKPFGYGFAEAVRVLLNLIA